MEKLLGNDAVEEAQRLAHTIKGVAGNVGAGDLQTAAARVEAAVKGHETDDLDTLLEQFGEALETVVDGVAVLEPEQETAAAHDTVAAPREQMLEALRTLAPHLKSRRPKPSKAAMAALGGLVWPEELADDVARLGNLVRKYKFRDAAAAAKALTDRLQPDSEGEQA